MVMTCIEIYLVIGCATTLGSLPYAGGMLKGVIHAVFSIIISIIFWPAFAVHAAAVMWRKR